MKNIVKYQFVALILIVFCAGCSRHACAQEQEIRENSSLVGRIAHIEGQLLRYVPDEDDWVLTDVDTPFGKYDNLFSSQDARVEIIMPNNTVARIGGDTQVQLIELTSETTEIDVSSGTARLYNKSSSAEIRATTPFGDVIMPPGTVSDIFVHEDQAEVASIKGTVEFIKTGSTKPHELIAGSSSIIATPAHTIASNHKAPAQWDGWNVARDVQWTRRMQARGESEKYLPESLQDHAFELEENGRWERVYYDGAYRYFWRPSYVSVGWTPFSSGRWIVWHGERTWVPCEPFGYVTHHYGNWVHVRGGWYWAPPVSRVMVSAGAPLLNIGMCWYPGRVAWLSSSISIGWFPLAPFEIYYCSSYWGPRCKVRRYHHYYDCRGYRHYRHARFIKHKHFHHSKNYRHAGLRKGHRGEKFRGSSRFPEKLRRNYKDNNRHRYASTMPRYREKVKKIDTRGIKRLRQASTSRKSSNPFKRKDAKGYENNRGPGKRIAANSSRNNESKNKRLEPASRKNENRRVATDKKIRTKFSGKAKQYTGHSTAKTVKKQQRVKTIRRASAGRQLQKYSTAGRNKPPRVVVKKTNTGTKGWSQRSVKTAPARRSYTQSRSGSYARSGSQGIYRSSPARTRQSGMGRAYASRGRR